MPRLRSTTNGMPYDARTQGPAFLGHGGGGGRFRPEFGYVLAPCLALPLLPTIVMMMLPSLLRKGSMHTFIFQAFCERHLGSFSGS